MCERLPVLSSACLRLVVGVRNVTTMPGPLPRLLGTYIVGQPGCGNKPVTLFCLTLSPLLLPHAL